MSALWKAFTAAHIGLFRLTGGRVAGGMLGLPVVLLTTTGRKTGKQRTVPLLAMEDGAGGDMVIIASAGGAPAHPAWYNNLVSNPDVTVERRGKKYEARATVAAGEERTRLWEAMATRVPNYRAYQKKVPDREIPVVVLKPKS